MSDYEVAELTWENGQLAMHGFGGFQPTPPTNPTWNRAGDTLESIVYQATCHNSNMNSSLERDQNLANISPMVGSSGGGNANQVLATPGPVRKRTRTEPDQCERNFSSSFQEERMDRSVCAGASANATFCRDSDRPMMTWASFESPQSLKTKTTDEDSACHDGSDEDRETKGKTCRSQSMRRNRAATIHNQSERRRRDRINQKMKALQKLVPNSSKTDKVSMLDEVIEYLKQLQAQIQFMSTVRNMPQMMLPMGMQQQQLHMSLLARMAGMGTFGLGMGMGMLDMSVMARTAPQSLSPLMHHSPLASAATPSFVQPPFFMPTVIPMRAPSQHCSRFNSNASVPVHDPYSALLAQQSMNMDIYSKMAALYRQQVNQTTQGTTNQLQSNHSQ